MELRHVQKAVGTEHEGTVYAYITAVRDAWLQVVMDKLEGQLATPGKLGTVEEVDAAVAILACTMEQSPATLFDAALAAASRAPNEPLARFTLHAMNKACLL